MQMKRYFNITGACDPELHYMVDLKPRMGKIKQLIDRGAYFTINRARQYGKTTTLSAIKSYLQEEYLVVGIDFQMLSHANFKNEQVFVRAFSRELMIAIDKVACVPADVIGQLQIFSSDKTYEADLGSLFTCLSDWCFQSEKPIVLMIDEVDSATNNQVFLDFLSQLRGYYIHRRERAAFQSVIMAGVYDVKNIKRKIRPDEDHKLNSPWNIATDFKVDMSLSADGIAGMLREYETDHAFSMDIPGMSALLYDYTSGYPFLVSKLCKIIDEELIGSDQFPDAASAWTHTGFLEANLILLAEKNTLFESMVNKFYEYPELMEIVSSILFKGREISYNALNQATEIAEMFGFVKNVNGKVVIANRIFETVFYNLLLTDTEIQIVD